MQKVFYASFDEVPSFKGASTHILANCRAILKHFDLTLVTLGDNPLPSITHGHFKHIPLGISHTNYLIRGKKFRQSISQLVRKEAPDLIHFRSPWEGMALVDRGIPTLYEVNGLPSIELPDHYKDISDQVRAIFYRWERYCLNASTYIICPSVRIKRCLIERYRIPAWKIQVILNGYDPPKALAMYTPHTGPLRAIYLGTLSRWQGVGHSLKAIKRLEGQVTLDIYAPKNKVRDRRCQKWIKKAKVEDWVQMKGPLSKHQFAQVLPQYDIGLAPLLKVERNTLQGCCPVKVIDYLCHGLFVVAPNLFIIRQIMDDPRQGVLYRPNSVRDLTVRLDQILQNREEFEQIRSEGPYPLNTPTWDEMGNTLLSIYLSQFTPTAERPVSNVPAHAEG